MSLLKDLLRPSYRLLKRGVKSARNRALLRKIPPLSSIDPAKPVYVFFAPNASTATHYYTHAVVARTIKDMGHQVLMVRCESNYTHCLAMDMAGLRLDKTRKQRDEICRNCNDNRIHAGANYGLPAIAISELLSETEIAEIRCQVAAMPADAGQFQVENFRFGALCGSDLALLRKALNQMQATGENRQALEAYVESALISYRAIQKLMTMYRVARVSYFNEYAMVLGAAVAAQKAGVPVTRLCQAIYRNVDHSKIALAAEPLAIYTYHRLLEEWPAWRDLALPADLVESISEHTLLRLSGRGYTVYSPGHGRSTDALFAQLQLSPDRKLVVAYPSSMDEYYANMNMMNALDNVVFAKDQPFSDQMTWMRELVAHVEKSDDLQLVIRMHPREGRNVHDYFESENLANLKRDFSGDYKHVRIVWPEEKISSYDLAEIADVALPAWSNISLELARLGIPTLTAFQRYVPFPIGDVVDWCPTPEEYFARIRALAMAPARLDQIRYAYRWTNMYSLSLTLDFSDLIPAPDYPGLPAFRQPKATPLVEDIIVRGASVTEINRQALLAEQDGGSDASETRALRKAMRQLIWFLATGKTRADDYVLAADDAVQGAGLAVTLDGDTVRIRLSDQVFTRPSRIIARLLPLAVTEAASVTPKELIHG